MGAVSREVLIDAPIDRVWRVVTGYASYPEFVPGVLACRVLEVGPSATRVEYRVDLSLRRVRYVLAHVEDPPRRLRWSLVEGELMERSDGSWELTPEAGRTRARYTVDVAIARPPLVPRAVVDRVVDELTRVQLPRTLDAFKARAEAVEGPLHSGE